MLASAAQDKSAADEESVEEIVRQDHTGAVSSADDRECALHNAVCRAVAQLQDHMQPHGRAGFKPWCCQVRHCMSFG